MKLTRIFDILQNSYENFPDKQDALVHKENGVWINHSVREYYDTAHKLSYGLIALGFNKGDRVATISNNRPEWNFLDMALNQTGLIHVPVYPTLSDSDYEFILDHADPKMLVVSDKSLLQKLKPVATKVNPQILIYTFNEIAGVKNWMEIYNLGKKKENELKNKLEEIKTSIHTDDLATLIYTSGTTGNPKGVMLSHKNIISNVFGAAEVFHFGLEDRTLSFLPICHVFERTINYYFQKQGVGIYYAENLGTISDNLKEVKPSIFIAVPRVLERIYDKIIGVGKDLKGIKKQIFFWAVNLGLRFEFHRKNGRFYHWKLSIAKKLVFSKWQAAVGNNIRIIVSGSAALQPRLIRIFNAAGIPLVEGYGMTETSPIIATSNYDKGEIVVGTVGPALPGMSVKISDDGEILAKGDSVMLGYYKDPEQTNKTIDKDGWLHTGDVGFLVDNKYVKITDRKKEMFKLSSGKYIAPQVIENKFKESFFIEQLMVVGENEKFASALISPNFPFLHNWCSRHGVKFRDNEDLIENPRVVARYQREVNEMNKQLGQTEHIKRFRLVYEEWSPDTGELSATLKLKRKAIERKYKQKLDEIYSVQKNGQ
ncbi:MAG: long-chain fatty acid--CoA ligase [Bacteroidales bacterium]|nr:long-chain fatty acid--CoA ligase [Bacteroidales bacterium]